MIRHYSSDIARQAARMLVEHESEAENYYLSRKLMNSLKSLRRQIFPRIEGSLKHVCAQLNDEQNLAAQALLKVLD